MTQLRREADRRRRSISGGFFVFDRAVLDRLSADPACVLEREPLERLAADGELRVYRHDGFWQCADTVRDVELLRGLWDGGDAPWRVWDDRAPDVDAEPAPATWIAGAASAEAAPMSATTQRAGAAGRARGGRDRRAPATSAARSRSSTSLAVLYADVLAARRRPLPALQGPRRLGALRDARRAPACSTREEVVARLLPRRRAASPAIRSAACPGVEMTGGSLGHGPAIAVGLRAGRPPRGGDARTFCLLGDGELNEGSVWEALALAAHLRLGSLVAIVDANGLQGLGTTAEVLALEPLAAKLAAFGWDVARGGRPRPRRARAALRSPLRAGPSAVRRPHDEGLRRRLHGERADVALPARCAPRTASARWRSSSGGPRHEGRVLRAS